MPSAADLERMRYAKPYDPTPEYLRKTSEAARGTKELLDALVQHAVDAEQREARMLWWTKAGVLLACVAAVAAIATIVLTLAVG
jgi:hypothetical protein